MQSLPSEYNRYPTFLSGDFEFSPTGDYLRTGNQYHSKHLYKNQVEAALSFKMKDSHRAKKVMEFYQNRIAGPLLFKGNQELLDHLSNCLLLNTYGLGCNVEHMENIFKNYSNQARDFFENNPEACEFFKDVANYENSLNGQSPVNSNKKKIVILTSHSGGGHLSTAESVEKIAKAKGYDVVILDQYHISAEKGVDAIQQLNAQYKGKPLKSTVEIWDEVKQKDDNHEGAEALWKLANRVREYLPNQELAVTVEKIREIKPEMIISTTTYEAEHAMLASMTNTPLHFIHTDYDLNPFLQDKLKAIDKDLVTTWVNSNDDELLEETKWVPGVEWGHDGSIMNSTLEARRAAGHLINYDEILELKRKGKIKVCGYPIRKSFVKETNPRKLDEIRQNLNILPNEKFGVLMMGRMGVAAKLKKYMQLLLNPSIQYPQPFHIDVVCGKNEELKKELNDFLLNLPEHEKNPNVRFTIDGFLTEQDVADRYNVADVLISKPGGATTAEAAALGLPMLCCDAYTGEKGNAAYLERHNLGQTLINEDTFVAQLMELASYKQNGKITHTPVSWETALTSMWNGSALPQQNQGLELLDQGSMLAQLIAQNRIKTSTKKEIQRARPNNSLEGRQGARIEVDKTYMNRRFNTVEDPAAQNLKNLYEAKQAAKTKNYELLRTRK